MKSKLFRGNLSTSVNVSIKYSSVAEKSHEIPLQGNLARIILPSCEKKK